MAGGTIPVIVHEDVTYDEMYQDADNLWNFLFFTGYLKKAGAESVDHINRIVLEMKIPNEEVNIIFYEKIRQWFYETLKAKDLSVFYKAI
ncbi:hypothetical protein R80B4_02646 [Fibrobacteres bacterium R8-0-B4]